MSVPEVPASLRSWMSAVSEIVRSVNAAEPLASVLTRVAEQACELIGFEFCAVMLADEQRECLQIAGWSGLTPDYLAQVSDGQGLRIRPPGPDLDTPAARAYREGRTIVVPDVREARSYGRLRHLAPTQGYRALLVAPLGGSGALAGVIVAYSVTARQFSGPELELIELLAGQAATALETARLRAEQQEVIRELSGANEEMRRGRAVLEWAERQHHQLMQLVLDEVELPELVAALASALRASVTVEDTDGRVLARAPAEGYCPPPAPAARRTGAARAALEAGEASGRRYTVARVPVRGPNGRVTRSTAAWAAPVVVGGELAGRLWVTDPPAEPEPVQLRVIERFALVVALLLLQQRHLLDVQTRLSGDLLGDLLRDGGPDPAGRLRAVLDRAAALGHDLSRPHVLALLTVDAPVPPAVGCPSWPGPRPSRVRSRWPGPTTGRTSCCCRPSQIPVTRCAASWPRPTRRSGRGVWSPWSPGRWPATRPGTRPRSGSPAARRRCAGPAAAAVSWTSAASGCPRCCSRPGRRTRCAASPPTCCTPWRNTRNATAGTCWPRCGPGSRPAARRPRRRTPWWCTATR